MRVINFALQTSLLSGTIIGAGIFSLPFVFKAAGLSIGFFYLILASLAFIFIYLMYADVILRTKGEHRFVGYNRIYLGKGAFWFSVLIAIVEMLMVMAIYLILSISFSNLILASGNALEKLLIFWFLGSFVIFSSLKRIAWSEFLITSGIIAIIAVIFILGIQNLGEITLLEFLPNKTNLLVPLAPILFALAGRVAIPTLMKYSRDNLRKAITAGVLIPALIYGIFVLAIIAFSSYVSEDAVTGLINTVPNWILLLIGILGILSLLSSYITIGLDVRETLVLDLKIPRELGFLIIVGVPPLIYLLGFTSFLSLVSFVGGIFLALEGLLIIFIWLKANKVLQQPSILIKNFFWLPVIFSFSIFVLALGYELFKILLFII